MTFGAKKSIGATEEAKFLDKRSFVAQDGRHILRGQDMSNVRKQALERDGNKCVDCGIQDWGSVYDTLQVHHIVSRGTRRDDRLENLTTLCQFCHSKRHVRVLSPKKETT